MRITIILLLSAIAGTAVGASTAYWTFYRLPEQAPLEYGLVGVDEVDSAKAQPTLELDEREYDFGVMDSSATATHEFVFRNVGSAPLELKKGHTTCKCTLSDIGDSVIPPGGSGIVSLEWNGKDQVGPYSQSAKIHTNDPRKPIVNLRIHGSMTAKARVIPNELVLSSVVAGQPTHANVRIFGYTGESLVITGHEIEDADYFAVSVSPIPDNEVRSERYATCGQRIEVTVKPGLPLGPFNTKIRLTTNLKDLPQLVIPVQGIVSSEIMILGRSEEWDADTATLRLGTLKTNESVRKVLQAKIGGLHPTEVEFEVVEVVPQFVKVQLQEKIGSPGGPVAIIPIEVEIPAGSPPGNYSGPKRENLGRVRLKTTNASVEELDVYIQFLIQG